MHLHDAKFLVKVFKRLLLHVLIQYEPNFIINMLVIGQYIFGDLLKIKNFNGWNFLLTQNHMVLEISNVTPPAVFI